MCLDFCGETGVWGVTDRGMEGGGGGEVIKRVKLLNLAKFCWQKRKTVGKLINGHIKHGISFQTKNSFN